MVQRRGAVCFSYFTNILSLYQSYSVNQICRPSAWLKESVGISRLPFKMAQIFGEDSRCQRAWHSVYYLSA